jgi:hypothetical protein
MGPMAEKIFELLRTTYQKVKGSSGKPLQDDTDRMGDISHHSEGMGLAVVVFVRQDPPR